MKFTLSNRHLKELHQRGRPLQIALPCPMEEPDDLMRWAQQRLPEVAGFIRSATIEDLHISASASPEGITGQIGAIQPAWREDRLSWIVPAVIVRLEPARVRQAPLPPAWPAGWKSPED